MTKRCLAAVSLIVAASAAAKADDWILDQAETTSFMIHAGGATAPVYCDPDDYPVAGIAAGDLIKDIERITGARAERLAGMDHLRGKMPIIIGTLGRSQAIDLIAQSGAVPELESLRGLWEGFVIAHVNAPLPGVERALVIAGSDRRGTAFGVYELCRAMGVSPFHWWADIPPRQREGLYVPAGWQMKDAPKVRYRGIFINDENFGLGPWATETHEPEHPRYVGPKTYEKVFEMILRLKGNYLWPATLGRSPFSAVPENRILADRHAIVMGSQHTEPLTSYGHEWNPATMGDFNYVTNKERLMRFLEDRVAANKHYENVYTMGLRGLNDAKMEGVANVVEQTRVLDRILQEQQGILTRQLQRPLPEIPQSLVLYKEVLRAYDFGFEVPDDITLTWPDDNYGYILRLPDATNVDRRGGHGVYYHLAYLGRPNDYDWLIGIEPALLVSEMKKAYDFGARKIWVFNVGDIKPNYYNIQLAFDLAWDPGRLDLPDLSRHQEAFFKRAFGPGFAARASALHRDYHRLNQARKAEHMSWGRLEQWRRPVESEFSWVHHREAERRIEAYHSLDARSSALMNELPSDLRDACFQLLHYNIRGARLMNEKWLYLSRHAWHQRQGRSSAHESYEQAWSAFGGIWGLTDAFYALRQGKWNRWLSMPPFEQYAEPRFRRKEESRRPLRPEPFEPLMPRPEVPDTAQMGIWLEGEEELAPRLDQRRLPDLSSTGRVETFLEIFNRGRKSFAWKVTSEAPWLKIEPEYGVWNGPEDVRVRVSLRPEALPASERPGAMLWVEGGGARIPVAVALSPRPESPDLKPGDFVEQDGVVSIPAAAFTRQSAPQGYWWRIVDGLGANGQAVQGGPTAAPRHTDDWRARDVDPWFGNPWIEYRFFTLNTGWVDIETSTLPTHPINKERASTYGVALNDGPPLIVDFATYQRSEEWMQAVEANRISQRTRHFIAQPGWQTLRLYLCDTGVFFDHITIDLGGRLKTYLPPPPTRYKAAKG